MDLSSTQQSPSIFSLDATIIQAVLVLPSFVILMLFYSNFALLKVHALRFFKIHIDC